MEAIRREPGKIALVIAADIALYKANNAAEPTQGAGAVAMIIDQPSIAEIEPVSYPFSMPVFDFWHPLEEQYPLVDGEFSLECYQEAARQCFSALVKDRSLEEVLESFKACCFHTPSRKWLRKHFLQSANNMVGQTIKSNSIIVKK